MKQYFIPFHRQFFVATFSEKGLSHLEWPISQKPPFPELKIQEGENGQLVRSFLKSYFEGNFAQSDTIKNIIRYDLSGTTFQKKVWEEIKKIPAGKVLSYKQLADKIHHPLATRAIGSACGKNPIPLIIPCHRIVASNGKIGGWSGKMDKKILLKSEGILF